MSLVVLVLVAWLVAAAGLVVLLAAFFEGTRHRPRLVTTPEQEHRHLPLAG